MRTMDSLPRVGEANPLVLKRPNGFASTLPTLTLILLLSLCGGVPLILLTIPDLPWTGQSMTVSAPLCGTWQLLARPNLGSDVDDNGFDGIGADANGTIRLVGGTENRDENQARPLMFHWDGSHLRGESGSLGTCSEASLYDVAVLSPDDAWAVGHDCDDMLIAHWDGDHWSRVSGPEGSLAGTLRAVVAVSKDDVWAVGSCCGARGNSIAIHWDGHTWNLTSPPTISDYASTFYDVTATPAGDVWAVGTTNLYTITDQGNGEKTLAMHWNGTGWEPIPSLNPCKGFNTFSAVTAASATDVWAVGNCTDDLTEQYISARQTLTEHWDGKQWKVVPGANPGLRHNLCGVAAISAGDVWAVGNYTDDNRGLINKTLVEHWDGKEWSTIPSPNPTSRFQLLNDVAISKGEVWVAGESDNGVLAARFVNSSCPTSNGGTGP